MSAVDEALAALEAALEAQLAAVRSLRSALSESPLPPPEDLMEGGAALLARAAAAIDVPLDDLRGKSKQRLVSRQRMVVAMLLYHAGNSLTEVADHMHRHHASVLNWQRIVRDDLQLSASVAQLAARLGVGSEAEAAAAERLARQRLANRRKRSRRR